MKRNLGILIVIMVLAAVFTGCSGTALTSDTIVGDWFCQLGEDGGLLENEYDFDLKADGTYTFTFIYLAFGIQDTNNSGRETGTWAYDEESKTLTLTPSSGSAYSFTIETLTYPKTRLYWTDVNDKLDSSGFTEGSDGVFTFDLYE